MAVISTDTFDPLRHNVGVRLQQAVPIVDADWNEKDDIQRFERRAFAKWFIGDGVPVGLDSFRVEGRGLTDDFAILAGSPNAPILPSPGADQNWDNGLRRAGHYLIDGMDLIIENDLNFTAQRLHSSQAGAAALAARLGVPVIAMPAPADGVILAYLDAWERLVRPNEDPSLVHPGLGVESCARLRREWAVRVRIADTVPQPGDADYLQGHSYSVLAAIVRRAVSGTINASDVSDRRRTGLTLNQHLRVPLSIRKGVGLVDSSRFALMLNGFRTSLMARLRQGQLPHATASATDEGVFIVALQNLMHHAQSAEVQTVAHNFDNAGALAFLETLYEEQDGFLDLMESIANVGGVAASFIGNYRQRLDGSVPDDIRGLRPSLDAGDLFDAAIAQEVINQFLSAPTDNLPEGVLNVRHLSVTPLEPLVAGTAYTFRYEVESLLHSPPGSEDIDLQVVASAASWQLVSVTPASLHLANDGGAGSRGTVDVVVRPQAAHNQCTLTLTAVAARNPLAASTQPGIALQIGAQPPAGSQFLLYADNPLNANGELEIPTAMLTDPFGRDVAVRLINDSGTETRTFALQHDVDPDDGDDGPWTPNPGAPATRNVQLNPNTSSTQAITIRCTTPEVGETAVIHVTATVTAVNGVPVAGGASAQAQILIRVTA